MTPEHWQRLFGSPFAFLPDFPLFHLAMLSLTIDAPVVLGIIGISCLFFWYSQNNLKLPPGPPRKWLIGNLLEFPVKFAWVTFLKWREAYGDIVYASVLGKPMVILSDIDVINDLYEKRADIYGGRPHLVMAGELMGAENSFAYIHQGPKWKHHRKLARIALSPHAIRKYHGIQGDITALFLNSLLENPADYYAQIRLAAGRIVMSMTYGLPADGKYDIFIKEAEETLAMITAATQPGAYLVDIIPILKYIPEWFPFATFHQVGKEGRRLVDRMITKPFNHVKEQLANGTAKPSYVAELLTDEAAALPGASRAELEDAVLWNAGSLYGAGGETTSAATTTFFLAMMLYPQVQAKAQAEIDRVAGPNKLPTMEDRPNLPYFNALIKEVLRWCPIVPSSVPRVSTRSDVYRGYDIPEGTTIIPNIPALAEDKRSGIPSEQFSPERFLPEHVKETPTDPYLYAFGFGRR